ncbi:hypothetical protein FQR65_LT08957 [Abscondita terminalis]|nr:hypothetical protein FQR65_LT08957 [Abscondita terminalis]
MASNEQNAQHLIAEAEKKLTGSKGFFSPLFGGSAKVEDAIECYQRAGNLFKMAKNWNRAGGAFCEAATLHFRAGSRHDAAINYVDAANCYKKSNINEAVNCMLKAIEIYTNMGRFTLAAKHHQSIAEIPIENYQKAIAIYEQVALSTLESPLLKYSIKEYLFRATLCHLCVDLLNAQHALGRYLALYPTFKDSREYSLLQTLIEHLEKQNVDSFTDAVKEYDSMERLDQWYTTILLRIKKQMNKNPDLR